MKLLSYKLKGICINSLKNKISESSVATRLARGSFWGLLGSSTSRILVLITMILIARILGQENFGKLGVVQSTIGTIGLLAGMGLGATMTRYIAYYSTTDKCKLGNILGMIKIINVGSIIFIALFFVWLCPFIAESILDKKELTLPLLISVLLMIVNTLRGVQNGAFAGFEEFSVIAKLNIIDSSLALISALLLAYYYGLNGAIIGLSIGALVSWFCGLGIYYKILKIHSIKLYYNDCFKEYKILVNYTLPNTAASLIATPILWYGITILSKQNEGLNEMGLYNAAYQWHGPLIFIPMVIMSTSIPILVKEWMSGNAVRFNNIVKWLSIGTLAISLPASILVACFSADIMSLYGSGFSDGALVLSLIVIAAPFHALSKVATSALLGMNKAWYVLSLNTIWSITMLLLAITLVPQYLALGLAASFLASYILVSIISIATVLLIANKMSA